MALICKKNKMTILLVHFYYFVHNSCLCYKDTSASNFLDLFFSSTTEKLGFDNHRLFGKQAFTKYFVVSLNKQNQMNVNILIFLHNLLLGIKEMNTDPCINFNNTKWLFVRAWLYKV